MKKLYRLTISSIAALVCLPLYCVAAAPSWCQKHETTVFNCQLGNQKVVSVCADPKLGQKTGYLQYRFGKINATTPELSYPKEQVHPAKHFKLGHYLFASASASWLSFENGDFRYVLKSTLGRDVNEQVLGVYQKSKVVAKLECKKTSNDLGQHDELLRTILSEDEHDEVEL